MRISVSVRKIEIPAELCGGDYENDRALRRRRRQGGIVGEAQVVAEPVEGRRRHAPITQREGGG